MKKVFILLIILLINGCKGVDNMLEIKSLVFENNALIPAKYTCDNLNINPPLEFKNIQKNTQSLVLIVDDPDAPSKTWVHWVVIDIPINIIDIKENTVPGTQCTNDFGKLKYGGPCPPSGTHRYFFKLYALNTKLNLPSSSTKEDVEKAMKGHIIEQATLIGLYKRK